MSINLQYSTDYCVSYPPSTKTLIWSVVKPRVTCSVPINTLVENGVETCTGFALAFEAPAPCSTVETCGAPMDIFWSAYGESTPNADITCKINRCKQS